MAADADFDLVRRCQSADPDVSEPAFRELYELYRDRVFNTAFRVIGNPSDAAEVAQDAFLTIFRKLGEFQFGSRFFTWMYRITVNLSIDRKRRAASTPITIEGGDEAGSLLMALADETASAPDAWADREFLETKVQASISRLSPKLRAIVVLRYVEGLAYGDIADILECSVGTVKSRLNRAHRSLEAMLKPVVEELAGRGDE